MDVAAVRQALRYGCRHTRHFSIGTISLRLSEGKIWKERPSGSINMSDVRCVLARWREADKLLPARTRGRAAGRLCARAGRSRELTGFSDPDNTGSVGFAARHVRIEQDPVGGRPIRIALLGTERNHRDAYPTAVAAWGDAADALGLVADVTFLGPPSLDAARLADSLASFHGVVLPGGADMINVPARSRPHLPPCETARRCSACVSACTAWPRQWRSRSWVPGCGHGRSRSARLVKSFTPMAANPALPSHRLGDQAIRIEATSRLFHEM